MDVREEGSESGRRKKDEPHLSIRRMRAAEQRGLEELAGA